VELRNPPRSVAFLLAASLLLTMGCATRRYDAYGNPYYEPNPHRHATEGAIVGGLASAGVGSAVADWRHKEAGFWIGGALGALTGAVVGDAIDRREAAPPPHPRYPDGPPPPYDHRPPPPYDDGYGPRHDAPGPPYDPGYGHGSDRTSDRDRDRDRDRDWDRDRGRDWDRDWDRDDWERGDRWDDDRWGARDPEPEEPLLLSLPGEVLFADGSARLEPGAERRLRAVATALRRHSGARAVVRGHASRAEPSAPALSDARARAVRAYLLHHGVAPSRVTALGMGARFPLTSERTAEGRQRNRRAEIEIHGDRGRELAGLW